MLFFWNNSRKREINEADIYCSNSRDNEPNSRGTLGFKI